MYHFIVNPAARSGLGKRIWDETEKILHKRGLPYEVHFTRYQTHGTKIARQITADDQEHTLVVLGGDGTVNEVINGIVHLSRTTLGYIPIGSSNDFARGLRLPKDPLLALERILSPASARPVRIGCVRCGGKDRRFAVSTGIGFDAAVCHQVMVSPLKKFLNQIHLGKLTYAGVALHLLLLMRPRSMQVILDGKPLPVRENVFFAAAMNLPYEGGGFKFCPKADCRDRKLDIILVSGISRWKALLLLPTAFAGLHTRFRGISIFTCRRAEFISEIPLPVHADGEPIFRQNHMSVRLEEETLDVLGLG